MRRLTNEDKAFVRAQLAQGLRSLGMDEARSFAFTQPVFPEGVTTPMKPFEETVFWALPCFHMRRMSPMTRSFTLSDFSDGEEKM